MSTNPAAAIAKGYTPYDREKEGSLLPRMIPAVKVVEAMDKAGFPESEWVTGVAVARRESSFVPTLIGAINPETRKVDPDNASWDFGLWQISYRWNKHLMEGPSKIGEWDDPTDNAKMALHLFNESKRRGFEGWRPWHTYTGGGYVQYIQLAKDAVATYKLQKKDSGSLPVTSEPPSGGVKEVAYKYESNYVVGITPANAPSANLKAGIVLHYPGASTLRLGAHETECRQQVRNWDRQHRNQGWPGLGYSHALCHHGIIMEGRGWSKLGTHAPGANSTYLGLLVMVANDKDMTPEQLSGFRNYVAEAKKRGVNTSNIRPHSDFFNTSCPGDRIRGRIKSGNWSTEGTVTPVSPGASSGSSSGGMTTVRSIKAQQEAVNAAGYTPKLVVDGLWGPKTDTGVKWYQKQLGVATDGKWGLATEAAHLQKVGAVPAPKQKLEVDGINGPKTISELQRALNEGRF